MLSAVYLDLIKAFFAWDVPLAALSSSFMSLVTP